MLWSLRDPTSLGEAGPGQHAAPTWGSGHFVEEAVFDPKKMSAVGWALLFWSFVSEAFPLGNVVLAWGKRLCPGAKRGGSWLLLSR